MITTTLTWHAIKFDEDKLDYVGELPTSRDPLQEYIITDDLGHFEVVEWLEESNRFTGWDIDDEYVKAWALITNPFD